MAFCLIEDDDLSPQRTSDVVRLAAEFSRGREPERVLSGRLVLLLFLKRSTRTLVSLEVAVRRLGGDPVILDGDRSQLANGETLADTARVLSGYCDLAAVRVASHDILETFAAHFGRPLINAMTDRAHPCQALADMLTISQRFGGLAGRRLTFLGDGNNVAHSLLLTGAACGLHVTVATPHGRQPDMSIVQRARQIAAETGGSVELSSDPREAASGADALYADVWEMMRPGDQERDQQRRREFEGFQINRELVRLAHRDAVVMHCLPARRGEEITDEVLDGERSMVWRQAHNRLYVNEALLTLLPTWTASVEASQG